jgi:segregation and condensation protein A
MIDEFDGPLDLLLHLIKKSNINICDIKLSLIADQYLEYINEMKKLDLDIASEYLVVAAELIEIKSKNLLPKEEEDSEDPEVNLIERIKEYEKYKNLVNIFRSYELTEMKYHNKEPEMSNKYIDKTELKEGITLDMLLEAFKDFLNKKEDEKPLNTKITTKEYSLDDRNKEIKNILKMRKKVYFDELFENFEKGYIVITFLSILDLCKKNEINITQENNFSKIVLEVK